MDIKTLYGFLMIGAGFVFQAVANIYGINGSVSIAMDSLIAAGIFLVSGKEIYNRKKGV